MILKYKVKFFDELDENDGILEESGVVSGEDYNAVFRTLQEFYGKDNITETTLEELEDTEFGIIPEDQIKLLFN